MAKIYHLITIVVFITLVEGLVIYINLILVPELQPARTAFIVAVATVANAIMTWHISKAHPELLQG